MRKKYKYFVNQKEMSRKDFVHRLEEHSQRVVSTDMVGCIGVDMCEFDKKTFDKYMREINNGWVLIIGRDVFSRKEVRV